MMTDFSTPASTSVLKEANVLTLSNDNDLLVASASEENLNPQLPLLSLPLRETFQSVCSNCQVALDPNSINYMPVRQDLTSYLKLCQLRGRTILSYYEMNNCLTDSLSNTLAELVISREIDIILNREKITPKNPLTRLELSTALLKNLANEISEVFNEKVGIYYSPGVTEGKNKINPSGKLQSQLSYARKLLTESGLLIISPRRNSHVDENSTGDLELLKAESEDWEETKKAWVNSYRARQQLIAESVNKLIQFNLYPCLSDDRAIDLITLDFNSKFTDAQSLKTSWPKLRSSIEDFILSKRLDDAAALTQVEKLATLVNDEKDAAILSLIPLAIKSNIASSIKRRKVEIPAVDEKTLELQKSFILKVENPDALEEEIEARRQILSNKKAAAYPFMVFVGPVWKPVQFYVIIDGVKLKVDSALDALDLTFKIFATTLCPYPKFTSNTYLLIEKIIYKVKPTQKSSIQLEKALSYFEKKLNTTYN